VSSHVANEKIIDLDAAQGRDWDVVIVGAGMGGGSAAYALAKKGHGVLLIEKGLARFEGACEGVEVEQEDPEERLANGKWPQRLSAHVDGALSDIWAPLGCGLGGSSLLYGAALQRLRPEDMAPRSAPEGDPIEWPFRYSDLEPYYRKAEKLFSVCGTRDPLESGPDYDLAPPPAMSECDRHYFHEFKIAGFNPYRLHVAVKYVEGCEECGGHICKRECKRDSLNSCIAPAMATGNLFVTERAEAKRIVADESRVIGVSVKQNGDDYMVKAKVVALAAGAYFTPVLLLKSRSESWPQGLANSSGLVGRNLMFHASDFIAFWPKQKYSRRGPNKTIAFRDLYSVDGRKLGEFQSTGLAAGYGNVLYALRLLFDQSRLKKLTPVRQLLRIPAYLASKFFGVATVFATIVEDLPYEDNRVLVDESRPSGMRFEYSLRREFRSRVMEMRRRVREQLSSLRSIPMNFGVSLNYGHPCGTCKAGNDPATSVVDKDCKAHELANLYVLDSSFMPTSGGTNPGLTIAANALRVADAIDEKLRRGGSAPPEQDP
jgi:choline dehydrogenase-like flavoprotein